MEEAREDAGGCAAGEAGEGEGEDLVGREREGEGGEERDELVEERGEDGI